MLTPKENFIRYLKGESYAWTPSTNDIQYFRPEYIRENVARGMINQQNPYTGKFGGLDLFGCEWEYEESVGGSMETGPLMEDLEDWKEKMPFPDLDKIDWDGCAAANRDYLNTDKIIESTIFTGYFERLIAMVGFENAAMALVDEDLEDTVNELFTRLTDTYIELIRRMHDKWGVGIVEIHDDWGNQRSLMFSEETHSEMIAPHITRLVKAAHDMGVFMEMHSCGMIERLIPNLISTGMDMWRGQALNDRHKLARLYGDRFHFAAELRPAGPVDDETAISMVKKVYEDWKGLNIWIALGRLFTPAQQELMSACIREHGIV